MEVYKNKRPRTPEQLAFREKELQRLDAEEEERLRVDATTEGNRLVGPLTRVITSVPCPPGTSPTRARAGRIRFPQVRRARFPW
jgi:hypothetical protein